MHQWLYMETDDFNEILKETELDSAKMILSLTSELKEKAMEIAALRSKNTEEIQRNNKAKEAEFEALSQAQEGRIRKREAEIARLLVEKEAQFWQKHQLILDEVISRHRAKLEGERARLNEELARKETEFLNQKDAIRAELTAFFKKREDMREEDVANERRTLISELRLGRETARREAEELWKEKSAQNAAETASRYELELEEARRRIRQEHQAETRAKIELLNEAFALEEKQRHADYIRQLAENKKLLEENFTGLLARTQADQSSRAAALEASLAKTEEELARRQTQWEEKHAELKKIYTAKETALENSRKDGENGLMASEKALADKYEKLEKELLAKTDRMKSELIRANQRTEAESAENAAALREQFAAREKLLNERETKLSSEREEMNRFRNQVADTILQRETELARAFEERYALLKESIEESARIKELGLARKYEQIQDQFSIISGQKDAALARIGALTEDIAELKRQLAEKDAYLRAMNEQEHARASELRKKLEEEFALKVVELREQLTSGEEAARKNLAESLKTETALLAEQYRVKEAGLAAQRDLMTAQAQELEARHIEALKAKEAENADRNKKDLADFNARLKTSRSAAAAELAEVRRRAEETVSLLRADYETRLTDKDLQNEQFLLARENQALAAARNELALENKKIEDNYLLKLRDMETRRHALEQNLKFALQNNAAGLAETARLKEALELITLRLEETAHEKQKLIQENLSKSKDLRQVIEKEFVDKLENVEKNYLGQMADALRRGEDREKNRQDEYFKKLAFIKEEYNAKFAKQILDLEAAYMEREARLLATLEDNYKLKEKVLSARFEQTERNYASALSDKTMQLDNDRAAAESVGRLKSELEARNRELNAKVRDYDKQLEEARQALEASFADTKKELEDDHRMKTAQLENERGRLKSLREQEQQLVTDLQKREAGLQETYAAKEAALIREFNLSRERLENDYQAKLKPLSDR